MMEILPRLLKEGGNQNVMNMAAEQSDSVGSPNRPQEVGLGQARPWQAAR